jgi:hypothetical protein
MLVSSRRALLAIARPLPYAYDFRRFSATRTLSKRRASQLPEQQKTFEIKMDYLPQPYSPQKHVIQNNRPAARKLRDSFPVDFIRQPMATLEAFSDILGVHPPRITSRKYVYVLDGEETFVTRYADLSGHVIHG